MNYKATELKIREAIAQMRNGKGSLFDLANWCVELCNDSPSYAAAIGIPEDHVIDHLNGYLRDFAVDMAELSTLLKFFPKREQWNRPLLDLLTEAHAQIAASKSKDADDSEPRARRAVKLAEHEKVKAELADATAEVKHARSMQVSLQQQVQELREENATLRGRLHELERIANRDFASVG